MAEITIESLKIRNPLIELWNLLRAIIQEEVIDPNTTRANSDSVQARNWIFAEEAEKNDERYPRGTINFSTLSSEPYAANSQIAEITDDNDNFKGDFKGVVLNIPVTIGIFVKRGQGYKMTLSDNKVVDMQNHLLNDHMAWLVKQAIYKNKSKFIARRFEILDDKIEVVPSYDNNSFTFVANIEFTIQTLDLWSDMISEGSIIADYVLSLEAEQIEG